MENKIKKPSQEGKENKGDKLNGILLALKDFSKDLLKSFLFLFLFLFFFFLIILMALKLTPRIPLNTFPGILFYGLTIIIFASVFGLIFKKYIGRQPIFMARFLILPIFLNFFLYFISRGAPIIIIFIIGNFLLLFFLFYDYLKNRKVTTTKQDFIFYGISFVLIAGLLIWAYFLGKR